MSSTTLDCARKEAPCWSWHLGLSIVRLDRQLRLLVLICAPWIDSFAAFVRLAAVFWKRAVERRCFLHVVCRDGAFVHRVWKAYRRRIVGLEKKRVESEETSQLLHTTRAQAISKPFPTVHHLQLAPLPPHPPYLRNAVAKPATHLQLLPHRRSGARRVQTGLLPFLQLPRLVRRHRLAQQSQT